MYSKKNGRVTFKSNRRTNFKRNNNYNSKGRNKGNVTQQYNKYLKLAKDTFSSGDRIQSEYYYQFTDHYYRLMIELGLNVEDQGSGLVNKISEAENTSSENNEESSDDQNDNLDTEQISKDEEDSESIESIPFISEPVKKKRTKSSQ